MKVAVDSVVFGYQDGKLKILLIKRKYSPFKDVYAFPGGFILDKESGLETVHRELKEETNGEVDYLEQLYTFTAHDRDPRGRVISIAYYALVNPDKFNIAANTDAINVEWVNVKSLTKSSDMAFDHFEILNYALIRLANKIKYEPIGFDLLPKKFKMGDLHRLYQCVLSKPIDIRNFQKKFLSFGVLTKTKEKSVQTGAGRKGVLYMFDEKKYEKLKKSGLLLEIQK